MTFRAVALGNDETTAVGDNSFTITVPASVQVGDVLLVEAVMNTGSGTFSISGGGTGSSWTTQSGPDDNNSNQRTYLWSKTATASSAGSTVTVTAGGASGRFVGILRADYQVTESGMLVAVATDSSADTSLASTSVTVPDATGWHLVGLGTMRVAAATAATVSSVPAGIVLDGQSNTDVASPNYTAYTVHKTATVGAGAQSLGTLTASASVTDNLYTVALSPSTVLLGAVATGTAAGVDGGAAFGSSAVAVATADAPAGEVIAATQDQTVEGVEAAATADAPAGLAPALVITATPEPDNSPPRVRIDISDTRATPATSVTVYRIDPSGEQLPVRTADGAAFALTLSGTARVGALYDYEAPFGQQVAYTLAENTTARAPITLDVGDVWLIHPGVPSRSMRVTVADMSPLTRRVTRGVYYPLGNRYPVVNTDGRRKAPEGSLLVRTESDPERLAMDALLDDAQTLLLNVPAGKSWGITTLYIAVADSEEARFLNWGPHPFRNWPLPFVAVARPAGGAQAQWNLDAVDAAYATLDAVKAAYPTLADLQANTPAA